MKKEALLTQQLKEQGYPSVGGIRRAGGSPQLIPVMDNWIRSKAHIEGDYICLDAEYCKEYYPERENSLVLLDFLNLDIHDQCAIIHFVERYGLLSYVGLEYGREDLDLWAEAHLNVSNLIQLHVNIQRAERDEIRAFNDLAVITDNKYIQSLKAMEEGTDLKLDGISLHGNMIERHEKGFYGDKKTLSFTTTQKEELIKGANSNLASCLSIFMKEIEVGVSNRPLSLPQKNKHSPTRSLVLDYRAPDLYGYLWLQVAFWAVDGRNLGRCICGCERYFPMTRVDRKYYSDSCGGNIRGKKGRSKDKNHSI